MTELLNNNVQNEIATINFTVSCTHKGGEFNSESFFISENRSLNGYSTRLRVKAEKAFSQAECQIEVLELMESQQLITPEGVDFKLEAITLRLFTIYKELKEEIAKLELKIKSLSADNNSTEDGDKYSLQIELNQETIDGLNEFIRSNQEALQRLRDKGSI